MDDHFPAGPKGAKQMTQYGVTALNKNQPLSARCALSWIICLALNMAILPCGSTIGLVNQELGQKSNRSAGRAFLATPFPGRARTVNMGPAHGICET